MRDRLKRSGAVPLLVTPGGAQMSEEFTHDQHDDQPEDLTPPSGEKLQKVLARAGLASRREIEGWISAGRVRVDGEVANLGARIEGHEKIELDGRPLRQETLPQVQRRVLIYNKREGEVCTRDDPEGRPTIFDRLPRVRGGRWINIGRLDINTTGLLMFTTDGELANRLMHPSYEMDREYAVRVRGEVTDEMIDQLKAGVMLEDGPAKFTDLKKAPGGDGFNHWFHCVVMEGRNREVRRLWEAVGCVVSRLKRVRFGPVFLTADMSVGRWREMAQQEVDILSAEVGLAPIPMVEEKAKFRERIERLQRKSATPSAPRRGPKNKRSDAARHEEAARRRERGADIAERPSDFDNRGKPAGPRRPRTGGSGSRPGFKR